MNTNWKNFKAIYFFNVPKPGALKTEGYILNTYVNANIKLKIS